MLTGCRVATDDSDGIVESQERIQIKSDTEKEKLLEHEMYSCHSGSTELNRCQTQEAVPVAVVRGKLIKELLMCLKSC